MEVHTTSLDWPKQPGKKWRFQSVHSDRSLEAWRRPHASPAPHRRPLHDRGPLTVAQGAALSVGAVLGTGVITLPALAAEVAGPASLLAWAALVLLSVPLASTFAALGARHPDGVASRRTSVAPSAAGGRRGRLVLLLRHARRGPTRVDDGRRLRRGRRRRRTHDDRRRRGGPDPRHRADEPRRPALLGPRAARRSRPCSRCS